MPNDITKFDKFIFFLKERLNATCNANYSKLFNKKFNDYYLKYLDLNILYIISICYIIFSFFKTDYIFICIFIILFLIIYVFKKERSIIFIFPLIFLNILYETLLKNNTFINNISKKIIYEGYRNRMKSKSKTFFVQEKSPPKTTPEDIKKDMNKKGPEASDEDKNNKIKGMSKSDRKNAEDGGEDSIREKEKIDNGGLSNKDEISKEIISGSKSFLEQSFR
jgi:hypothetical protein